MAQTIEVNTWCDGLQLDGTEWVYIHDPAVKAITRTFGLDSRPAKHVDLCDDCNDNLTIAALREVVKRFGASPESKKAQPGPRAASGGPAATAAMHQTSGIRHGRTPKGSRDLQCLWCPLTYTQSGFGPHLKAHGFDGMVDGLGDQCPVCGTAGFKILSIHTGKEHDMPVVTDAFLWARDHGDPYGVYAARRDAGRDVVESLVS